MTTKVSRFAPFVALLVIALALAAASYWFRRVETPPWRVGGYPSLHETAEAGQAGQKAAEEGLGAFTFLTYNVKNWLVSSQSPEKTKEAKQAVIRILANAAPDVIGLCEIGSMDDVLEIQSMLKAEGMDYPYAHHAGGADPVRHLALLSRYPIISKEKPDPRIPETQHTMPRGILDATVRIGGREIRFLGLHLKSKRTVPEFDEAKLRIEEAGHVRKHIDTILAKDPGALLLAYGDFNDTTRSLSTRMICGTYRTPGYMNPIHVTDSHGETWTHHFAEEDSYTRIDFVTVSQELKRHVSRNGSRIVDDPLTQTASDHRPVLIRFE